MLTEGLKRGVKILEDAVKADEIAEFALIGGLAVSRLGFVRATLDIDFGIRVGSQGLDSLARRVQGSLSLGESDDPLKSVLTFQSCGAVIQLIEFPPALSDILFARIELATVDDLSFPAASLEAMILLKLYAGGPGDIEDIRGMLRVQELSSDELGIIRGKAEKLRLSKRFERALESL